MAQNVGFSRVQLYRRLVSITGHTPSELIRIIRLRHAEQLLAESQLTVSEIAYKVGFSSIFQNVLKIYLGICRANISEKTPLPISIVFELIPWFYVLLL